jgi:hypothetical protein
VRGPAISPARPAARRVFPAARKSLFRAMPCGPQLVPAVPAVSAVSAVLVGQVVPAALAALVGQVVPAVLAALVGQAVPAAWAVLAALVGQVVPAVLAARGRLAEVSERLARSARVAHLVT